MKIIKKGSEILKVTDEVAEKMVRNQGWSFKPKSVWKEYIKTVPQTIAEVKKEEVLTEKQEEKKDKNAKKSLKGKSKKLVENENS